MAKRSESKSAFILSFPATASAKEIVEAGEAKGMKLTVNRVSSVRQLASSRERSAFFF
jgi:hypothetical protein